MNDTIRQDSLINDTTRRDYAISRCAHTGSHYLITTMGHVLHDCRHNRRLAKEMLLEVEWSTKETIPA
jgi:acyl-[acyl carrier protein]--UDP-N-acetylglucosamine O-acyltransferase